MAADSRRALAGMQPQSTQVPPRPSRSTTRDGQSQLGAANRADVSGGAAADEDDVKGSHKLLSGRGVEARFGRVGVTASKDTGFLKKGGYG